MDTHYYYIFAVFPVFSNTHSVRDMAFIANLVLNVALGFQHSSGTDEV